jgi:hypothetical protein
VHDGRSTFDMEAGASSDFEVVADAAMYPREVYGLAITYAGASVLHQTKKYGAAVANTHEGESIATTRATEYALYGKIVLTALDAAPDKSIKIYTDNLSNQRVADRASAAARTRHLLIRYACLHKYVQSGDIRVLHISDTNNPSDYLTKFVPAKKYNDSIYYLTNKRIRDAYG